MAIGDYNADGLPDILISGLNPDSGSRELWLCLNTCTGEHSYSFDNHRLDNLAPYATTSGIIDMADLNNDGLTDLILTGTTDTADKSMTILLNNGDGTFTRATSPNGIPAIKAGGVDVCDINADGLADIIYAGECDRERFNWAATGVLVNQGDGTFVNYDYDFLQVRSGASVRAADYRRQGRSSIALMGYGGFGLYDQTGDAPAASALADHYEQVASFHGTNLKVQADPETTSGNESDNVTTLSWSPLGPGYRYNYVVKLKDGSMVSAIPCDPSESNRTLLTTDTRHATAASSVRLNVNRKDVEMWGVHAIAPDKSTSLVYLDNEEIRTGVENVAADFAADPASPEYFTLQGVKVANPSGGIFLERRGNRVVKRIIK